MCCLSLMVCHYIHYKFQPVTDSEYRGDRGEYSHLEAPIGFVQIETTNEQKLSTKYHGFYRQLLFLEKLWKSKRV